MKERSLTDLFHRVKKVLPEEQELLTFYPEKTVAEALKEMRDRNLSQVPVVAGSEVLGVFSYRSFADGIPKLPKSEKDLMALPVAEFLEDLTFARMTDDLAALLDELDLKDAVLVGSPDRRPQGIITTIDVLRYFYDVASPFIMLGEVELAVRELIRASVDEEQLVLCIGKSLKQHYDQLGKSAPTSLEEMSLHDYVMLLRFKETWDKFKGAFGGTPDIVYTKLKPLPDLRNDLFHFRREITVEEYEQLRQVRDWLLKRIRILEGSKMREQDD